MQSQEDDGAECQFWSNRAFCLGTRARAHAMKGEHMKSFVAEDSFWELFPQAAIGVVVVKGMKPAAQIPQEDVDAIAALLDRANIDAERHLTSDTISENAPVKAWREAYRLFKTKKGARCSIENLLKRVLKGKPVGHITPAVDIYNTVSLTYALPVGEIIGLGKTKVDSGIKKRFA